MNLIKLKEAEASFFTFYPKGFEDEALLPINMHYTQILKEMKSHVSPMIGADNAGFTGFLMMAMK